VRTVHTDRGLRAARERCSGDNNEASVDSGKHTVMKTDGDRGASGEGAAEYTGKGASMDRALWRCSYLPIGWVIQSAFTARLIFFMTGHKYDFGALQVSTLVVDFGASI
jgi:hypothetical protein